MLKQLAKQVCSALALLLMFFPAATSGFGRVSAMFLFFGQFVAIVPGLIGDYLRVAYYRMTLEGCAFDCRISFGTLIAQSATSIGRGVYIGAYCVIGSSTIGARTQIASQVQILSGRHQHDRDRSGRILGSDEEEFTPIVIGSDCWVGAGAIVMADIADETTVGAGSIVIRALPPGVTAVGNPARVLEPANA